MRLFNLVTPARWASAVALTSLLSSPGCTFDDFLNKTASLGGSQAGDRGTVRIAFINHTPFRAIFTYGTYDPEDPGSTDFPPVFRQFFIDSDSSNRLEGNSESGIVTLTCAHVVSIGGEDFINQAKSSSSNTTQVANASEEAFTPGISFSDKPLTDVDAGQPTAGSAPAFEAQLGADFQCGSLLVFTFEVDDTQASGFRVDLQVILP